MAPVFPAETTASARPSPTARQAATSELSGFARTASAGFSSIPIASAASTSSSPCVSSPGGPKMTGSTPSPAAAERAGDDLRGAAIPAQRVDRDAGMLRAYGAGARSGSTSRPRYVLQFGQTRCGSFGWWQFGHSFTRGDSSLWVARRLSRRDFEVFFLGTATAAAESSSQSSPAPRRVYSWSRSFASSAQRVSGSLGLVRRAARR